MQRPGRDASLKLSSGTYNEADSMILIVSVLRNLVEPCTRLASRCAAGMIAVTQRFLPQLRVGRPGRIINIGASSLLQLRLGTARSTLACCCGRSSSRRSKQGTAQPQPFLLRRVAPSAAVQRLQWCWQPCMMPQQDLKREHPRVPLCCGRLAARHGGAANVPAAHAIRFR